MTRTPDEIKKGLTAPIPVHYHHGDREPHLTPLAMVDLEKLHANALALIQQLQEEVSKYEEGYDALTKIIKRLEAERDAAVETIYEMAKCITEDVCEWCDGVECERLCMQHTILRPGFKWRGVQKEE